MQNKLDNNDLFLEIIDDPVKGKPNPTLSFTRSPLVLLGFTANRFSRASSRIFKKKFGIGTTDWRMLVMFAWKPDSPASIASQTIGIDKAAVSRSIGRLEKLDLVIAIIHKENSKRPVWRLTQKGYDLHEEMLKTSLNMHETLMSGFSEQDIERLNGYLELMIANLKNLDEGAA